MNTKEIRDKNLFYACKRRGGYIRHGSLNPRGILMSTPKVTMTDESLHMTVHRPVEDAPEGQKHIKQDFGRYGWERSRQWLNRHSEMVWSGDALHLLDVWARACAVRVAHLWQPMADVPHRLGEGRAKGWRDAVGLLLAPRRGMGWRQGMTWASAEPAAREADRRATFVSRQMQAQRVAYDDPVMRREVAAASHAANGAWILLSSALPHTNAVCESVKSSTSAANTMGYASVERGGPRYEGKRRECIIQDEMLRSLFSALLYVEDKGPFAPSPHLDWWWYYQVVSWYRPDWVKLGPSEGEPMTTRDRIERMRSTDHPIMRKVLAHAWRRYWEDTRGQEPPDWPIIWAACKGGGAL